MLAESVVVERRILTATAIIILTMSSVAHGTPVGERVEALPNLVPLPPEVELGAADRETGETAIRLTVSVANRGDAHLDLLGIPGSGQPTSVPAHQCVAWTTDRICESRAEVGSFIWHPDHAHHHFEGFALYELRALRRGRPDMRPRGLIRGGDKISFCLIDYEPDDGSNTFMPGTGLGGWPLYSTCVAGSGYQGISRGWRDVYSGRLVGQQIVVDAVPPGDYALVVTIDPELRLIETDDADNTIATRISLSIDTVTESCVYTPDLRRCEPR